MNDENSISVSGLVKTFGKTRAPGGLDLSVRNGEVHGFLGPNGAGKSTTLRVLLGLICKYSGEASLLGGAVRVANRGRRRVHRGRTHRLEETRCPVIRPATRGRGDAGALL
jgi:ABC-type multidrug transport system ATPase subunit